MDFAEQLRILEAAGGDNALLSLAVVDLTYGDLPAPERERLRHALLAAAVPHWCDDAFLAALLDTTLEEAAALMARLRTLSNVEPFPARGLGAVNVHEASRLPLREHLRTTQPELWKTLAIRARAHVSASSEAHARIEALYHLFAADPAAAAAGECAHLSDVFHDAGHPEEWSALAVALTEITAAGWLTGPALVEALIAPLWVRVLRGETAQLEQEARAVLALARTVSPPASIADAACLMGNVHKARGDLDAALAAYQETLAIFQRLTAQDPTHASWQRELAVAHSKVGGIHEARGELDAALTAFQEDLAICRRLTAQDPSNSGWQRDLAVAHSTVGDIHHARGELDSALTAFEEYLAICQRLAIQDTSNVVWQHNLAVAHSRVGDIHEAWGGLDAALTAFQEYLAICQRLAALDPSNAGWRRDLAAAHHRVGVILASLNRHAESLASHQLAVAEMVKAVAMSPENPGWKQDLEILRSWLEAE